MVPEVGRESIAGVIDSIDAMAELTRRLIDSGAESVILISPHAPLEVDSFVAYEGRKFTATSHAFTLPKLVHCCRLMKNCWVPSRESLLRKTMTSRLSAATISITVPLFRFTSCCRTAGKESGDARIQFSFE